MRKHAFLVRWHREGRTVRPILDSYASCIWPLGPEDNDVLAARALLAMIDGHKNLPKEVIHFCSAYEGMVLRLRYSNGDTTGPYLINDDDDCHTDQTIQEWLASATDGEIARYHANVQKVNRRIR